MTISELRVEEEESKMSEVGGVHKDLRSYLGRMTE
jgi:hypothetical protein